jgi:hypothetical protein
MVFIFRFQHFFNPQENDDAKKDSESSNDFRDPWTLKILKERQPNLVLNLNPNLV